MRERTRPAAQQAAVEPPAAAPLTSQARLARWREPGAQGGHLVRFFRFGFPARRVARFLRAGLAAGEAAVVVTSPRRAAALRRHLPAAGVTWLDSAETLARILVHERPDRVRFDDVVGQAVRRAAAQANGRVRAYGDMVDVLCDRGEPEAAAELEGLWNELGRRLPLRLLCAYATRSFTGRSRGHGPRLAALHTHRA